MTTDPTITIAGLTAERDMLRSRLRDIAISVGAANEATCIGDASRARVAAERDALAAQLAEVRAELDRLRATDLTRDAAESTAADQLAILRADLASERAHLAACRTRIAGLEQAADERSRTPCNGSCDIALASRQVGPDGIVPRNARECAELWEREAARLWHDYLTVVDALAPSTSGPEHAAEIARDLRHRVAELEARPVLTVERLGAVMLSHEVAAEVMSKLGPVTLPLPAQDRVESDERAYARRSQEHSYWPADVGMVNGTEALAMGAMLRSVGPLPINDVALLAMARAAIECVDRLGTSPTVAPPEVFAGVSASDLDIAYIGGKRECHRRHDGAIKDCCRYAAVAAILARLKVTLVAPEFLRRIPLYTKHGPNGKGDPGICDAACVKCEAERILARLTAAGVPVTPERK